MVPDVMGATGAHAERLGLVALSRTSLLYALGGLAYKGVALLTIPLLARLLSPAQLGLLDIAAVMSSIVGLVAVLGTDQAVAYLEPHAKREEAVWSSALLMVVVASFVLAAAAIALAGPLAGLLAGDATNAPIVVASALYAIIVALTSVGLNAIRLRGTPRAYAVASFLLVTAEMSVALGIAWFARGPVALLVLGWAFGATVVLAPILLRYFPRVGRPRRATVGRLVRYGAPLVPMAIAWLVGDAMIRATLAREAELANLGEYGIAYRIASVLGLAVTGFGVAWYPYLFRSHPTDQLPRASDALAVVILVLAALGVGLTALSPELISIVAGPGYADARNAVGPLAGGMVALGAFTLIGGLVGTSGSTTRIAAAAFAGVIGQVGVANALVPALGLTGAGIASLGGYTLAAVLLGATELRLFHGRRSLATALAICLTAAGFAAALVALDAGLLVRAGIAVVFGMIVGVVVRRLTAAGGWIGA